MTHLYTYIILSFFSIMALSQNIEYSSLSYTIALWYLPILYVIAYVC